MKGERMLINNLQRRRLIFPILPYLNFFVSKDPFKKDDVEQKMFMENLALLIMKNHLPMQFVKNMWLKCLMLQLCPHV
jgi:hypothetical protein